VTTDVSVADRVQGYLRAGGELARVEGEVGGGMPWLASAPAVALDRVRWRIDSKAFKGRDGFRARYVPYLDAALVAGLMDAWVGPGNWRDLYEDGVLAGKPVLWCHVEVRVSPGEWVRKTDVGVTPSGEGRRGRGEGLREKGTVSDAFKRAACLKWGAGRNVYDLPTLWGPAEVADNDLDKPRAPEGVATVLVRLLKERGFDTTGVQVDDEPEEQETVTDAEAAMREVNAAKARVLEAAQGDTALARSAWERASEDPSTSTFREVEFLALQLVVAEVPL